MAEEPVTKWWAVGAKEESTARKYISFLHKHSMFGGHVGLPQDIRNEKPNHSLDSSRGIYDMVEVYSVANTSCPTGTVVNFYVGDDINNPLGTTYVKPCYDTTKPMGYMVTKAAPDIYGICVVSGVLEVPLANVRGLSSDEFERKDYVEYDLEAVAFKFSDSGYPVFNAYQDVDGDWIAIILWGNTSVPEESNMITAYTTEVMTEVEDNGTTHTLIDWTTATVDHLANYVLIDGNTNSAKVYINEVGEGEDIGENTVYVTKVEPDYSDPHVYLEGSTVNGSSVGVNGTTVYPMKCQCLLSGIKKVIIDGYTDSQDYNPEGAFFNYHVSGGTVGWHRSNYGYPAMKLYSISVESEEEGEEPTITVYSSIYFGKYHAKKESGNTEIIEVDYAGAFRVETIVSGATSCDVKVYNSLRPDSPYAGRVFIGHNYYNITGTTISDLTTVTNPESNITKIYLVVWYDISQTAPEGAQYLATISGGTIWSKITTDLMDGYTSEWEQTWFTILADIIYVDYGEETQKVKAVQSYMKGDAEIVGRWI